MADLNSPPELRVPVRTFFEETPDFRFVGCQLCAAVVRNTPGNKYMERHVNFHFSVNPNAVYAHQSKVLHPTNNGKFPVCPYETLRAPTEHV